MKYFYLLNCYSNLWVFLFFFICFLLLLENNTEVTAENDEEMRTSEISAQSKFDSDDDLVLGVYIHRSDRLKTDLVSHPVVKIHIVDQKSGLYVKKDHR